MDQSNWNKWLERLYNLRRDKRGTHERPHKPVLLLSIIDLIERGIVRENRISLNDQLIKTFKLYFDVVRVEDDKPTVQNPFYYLAGDKFWHHAPVAGEAPIYNPGYVSGCPSVKEIQQRTSHAEFDQDLWKLLANQISRHQIREAIIDRYFPEKRSAILPLLLRHSRVNYQNTHMPGQEALNEFVKSGRDAAFRRTILEIYDYTCAACGIRLVLNNELSLVEAAHIIPFMVDRNDKPTNGLALCPNHHWAMDRHLIAPCPGNSRREALWKVSPRLDDRLHGQRDLIGLAGKSVIFSGEEKFYPDEASLRWREEHLVAAY